MPQIGKGLGFHFCFYPLGTGSALHVRLKATFQLCDDDFVERSLFSPGPNAARVTPAGLGDGRSAIITPELIAGSRRTGSPQDHTPENLSYREIHLNCVRNGNIRTASGEVSTATGFWPTPPRFLVWKKKVYTQPLDETCPRLQRVPKPSLLLFWHGSVHA